MWDYRARWKFIGIQLDIDTGTLDAIEKDCKTVDDCLLRMIKGWLRNSPRPTVTRESIRVALQSKHVSNAEGIIMQASLIIILLWFYNKYYYLISYYYNNECMMMLSSLHAW